MRLFHHNQRLYLIIFFLCNLLGQIVSSKQMREISGMKYDVKYISAETNDDAQQADEKETPVSFSNRFHLFFNVIGRFLSAKYSD